MFDKKKKVEISSEIQWTPKEIDDWISLDERKLEANPGIEPMNPFEIRAKHLDDIFYNIVYENIRISYIETIDILIKNFGKEIVDYGLEQNKIPSSEEEFTILKRELA